ncbi:MAG: hypothetical protein ACREU2_09260 [Steroidobacteraceae bacterium]
MLRFCLPRVRTQGHGLGNELVPWARAFLASQVLQARLLPPAFGLNRRSYWRDFRSPPDDWVYNRALERLLPVVNFTEADYLAHGGGDVVTALRSFAAAHKLHQRSMYVLATEGLWGGYYHVQAARDFIRSTLYRSRYAASNLLQLRERIDPDKVLVGMHVRLGDFKPAGSVDAYNRAPNVSLPLEWFRNVALSLQRALGNDVQLLLISDGTREQLRPLLDAVPCISTADLPNADCSDALALADADLLVCSASTYSTLAAFLSDSPCVFFAPSLYRHPEGCYSSGDAARDPRQPDGPRERAVREFVAVAARNPAGWVSRAIGVGLDGAIPDSLIETLRRRRSSRRWQADLVRFGVAAVTPRSP